MLDFVNNQFISSIAAAMYVLMTVALTFAVVITIKPIRSGKRLVYWWILGYAHSELGPLIALTVLGFAGLTYSLSGFDHYLARIAAYVNVLNVAALMGLYTSGFMTPHLNPQANKGKVQGNPQNPVKVWAKTWNPVPLVPKGVMKYENIVYGNEDEVTSAGKHGKALKLDVFSGQKRGANRPVLVYIHGGAWIQGSKKHHGLPHVYDMAERGWVVVSINYRLSPHVEFPAHLIDCKRAIRWVKEHISEYGGQPDFITVSGGSAGGHLASLVALTSDDKRYQPGFEHADTAVQGCVAWYPVMDVSHTHATHWPYDMTKLWAKVVMPSKCPTKDLTAYREASPLHRVTPHAPPLMVIMGTKDNLVPVEHVRLFVATYTETTGRVCHYLELPGAHHAFDLLQGARTH
eukprot:Colp12_sorted_trinity150504_noHs@8376